MNPQQSYRIGWILLILVILAGIGLRWPTPADEPRFALIAKEMVETGQWLIPHRVGELYPDKPPVFMWAIAALIALKIPLKVAFLLPSALAALGTAWLTVDLSRRLFGAAVATQTLWLLGFTLQFTLQAKTAQIDMMEVFWLTLCGYGLLRHLLLGPDWRWYWIGFAAAGVGVLTKGVGFLSLFLLLPLLWRPDLRARMSARGWLGPVVMLAVVGVWVLPMLWYVATSSNPEVLAYRNDILINQTANRYVHALGHEKGWYYYLVEVIPILWLPMVLLVPFVAGHWWRERARPDVLLPLVTVLGIVVFFTLSPGKRGVYLTPALPWLALAIAPFLDRAMARRWCVRLWNALMWLLAGAVLAAAAVPQVYERAGAPGVVVLAVSGLAMLAVLALTRGVVPWQRWGMAIAALWLGYSLLGPRATDPLRTPIDIMQQASMRMGPEGKLALVHYREQFALFADRPVVQFGYHTSLSAQRAAARDWVLTGPQYFVLGPGAALERCFALSGQQALGSRHGKDWYLVDAGQLQPGCEPGVKPAPRYQGPDYGIVSFGAGSSHAVTP